MGVPESPAVGVAHSGPSPAGRSDVAAAEQSAEFLQQRLKVGAGMLKALQAQIDQLHDLSRLLQQRRQEAEQALERVDDRIALAADRAEVLSNMVESAEVNLAVLAGRAARAARGVAR